MLEIEIKQRPDRSGFLFDNLQGSAIRLVAKRHVTAHPQTLLLRGRDLVANTFGRDLAFELGKR